MCNELKIYNYYCFHYCTTTITFTITFRVQQTGQKD